MRAGLVHDPAALNRARDFVCMGRQRNIAVLLAILVGAVLWIEHGNHIVIEAADHSPCADSDAMPYGARCIEFMMGSARQSRP